MAKVEETTDVVKTWGKRTARSSGLPRQKGSRIGVEERWLAGGGLPRHWRKSYERGWKLRSPL
jgi:hypothetical protein